jgi:small subunit ribosomal protein S17
MTAENKRGSAKTRVGEVVSCKMDKTVVVKVDRRVAHPVFKKIITRSSRFYAHCVTEGVKVGDTVRIVETRPLSKLKRWRVREVIAKATE